MAYSFISVDRRGPAAYVTLNRPEVRNALNPALMDELRGWTREASHDASLGVVVLGGAGKAFCAGADVAWMAAAAAYSEDENLRDATALAETFRLLDTLPVPLIGRVHGAVMGGGLGLVAACDIVVAEAGTTFGFTEVRLGIAPATIAPFVIAKIGHSAARHLFLTGALFPAARAQAIGLVHDVVADSELDAAVQTHVDHVLRAGPDAIAAAKALIARVWSGPSEDTVRSTAQVIAERRASPEGQEGLAAFLAKRTPRWTRAR